MLSFTQLTDWGDSAAPSQRLLSLHPDPAEASRFREEEEEGTLIAQDRKGLWMGAGGIPIEKGCTGSIVRAWSVLGASEELGEAAGNEQPQEHSGKAVAGSAP